MIRLGNIHLLCSLLYSTIAIQPSGAWADAPPSVAITLQRLGISLDHSSLCRALKDPRTLARSAAAAELAEEKDETAVPDIEAALNSESDRMGIFNLSTSLVILGSETGIARMKDFCSNSAIDEEFRLRAADILGAFRHDFGCAPFILGVIMSSDANSRRNALLYLDQVPSSEKGHAAFGPPLLAVAVNDANPELRVLAGKALMRLGDEASQKAWALAKSQR